MVPVGAGVRREYADMQRSFTCCVGTGMESHALHGLGVYHESGNRLWVNLYTPSTAQWKDAGITITMQTTFPEGETATMTVDARAPKAFTLALRRPSWSENGFGVKINGQAVAALPKPGSYVKIDRTWKSGDTVAIALPKTLHLSALPDDPKHAAVMLGPMVMAGDLGAAPRRREDGDGDGARITAAEAPVIVTDRPVGDWVKPVAGRPGVYRATGVAKRVSDGTSVDVDFIPFHQIHRRTYAAYWEILTPAAFRTRMEEAAAERERQRTLAAASIATLAPVDAASEKPFHQQGEETTIVRTDGRPGRRSAKWFSYDLPIRGSGLGGDGDAPQSVALVVTYNTDNRRARSFEILADGQRIGAEAMPMSSVAKFVDVEYPLPADLVRGKQKVTVTFR